MTAVFSFLDRLPEGKLFKQWIPQGLSRLFSFLNRLPESRLFTRIIPGVFVALGRVLDEFTDHALLLIRELFLTNREELRKSRGQSVFTRMACAIAEGLHRLGLIPRRFLPHRASSDAPTGTAFTSAISFGLLLGAAGLVAAILYVFIRMGA